MTAVVRSLFRTTTAEAPSLGVEPVDYCECNRGPIIGAVGLRAAGSNDRLCFFPLGSIYASISEFADDLRCLDCVTEAVVDLASGKTVAEMEEITRQRRAAGSER